MKDSCFSAENIATLILWASNTQTEVLSDTSEKPQWNFNSLGHNIAFSCVEEMECALGN